MGNISGQDELVTKQELAAFYQAILPYLGNSSSSGGTTYTAGDGIDIINDIISTKKSTQNDMDEIIDTLPTGSSITTVSGYTPLGTIISYYGETAPRFYLACDGSEYNKSDYPELANHLLSLTNHSQYEVDGDNTKFKVPDLRGEFLRGTGTNSHSGQGNGTDVGVHQDGTTHAQLHRWYNSSTSYGIQIQSTKKDSSSNETTHADSYIPSVQSSNVSCNWKGDVSEGMGSMGRYTSRPTNTSVLYCIAYKDIYTSPMNDYSTDEKIVGTWVDGKPLYQIAKYYQGTYFVAPKGTVDFGELGASNVDLVIDLMCTVTNALNTQRYFYGHGNFIYDKTNDHVIFYSDGEWSNLRPIVTMLYTKTTD